MLLDANPGEVMKQLRERVVKLRDSAEFDKELWKELYNDDFQRHQINSISMEEMLSFDKVQYRFEDIIKEIKEGDKVLDVGCSDGYFLNALLLKKMVKAYGVDASSHAINAAREHNKEFEFKEGFVEYLPYDNDSFDVVVCSEVLEHVYDVDKSVSELKRVCKPGGKLFITTPIMMNLLDPLHIRFFDYYKTGDNVEGLWELFSKYFTDFKIYTSYKNINEKNGERIFYIKCKK